eukprot:gene8158-16774_t
MRVVQERRTLRLDREKRQNVQKSLITKETSSIHKLATGSMALETSRLYYAASKIQALIRGFLARRLCAELLRQIHAAIIIQRTMRGKLGRMRWMNEFWSRQSVVKSKHALALIVTRSKIIREEEVTFRGFKKPGAWKELYDPATECFWYYNTRTGQNTWQCPVSLQKEFVCKWEGFHIFGGRTNDTRCRCVFNTAMEYHNHLSNAHSWHCEACGYKNTGVMFPTCGLCENTKSGDGEDGEQVLRERHTHIHNVISSFLKKDYKHSVTSTYRLKD